MKLDSAGCAAVPMADEVGAELERLFQRSHHQHDGDLVFAHPATGGPLHKPGVLRRMRRALKAAGLDETHRFHDLRHTFGTRMAAAGVPMRTLQEWLGHCSVTTTQIYADYSPSSREADMIAAAFARGSIPGSNLSESESISENSNRIDMRETPDESPTVRFKSGHPRYSWQRPTPATAPAGA